AVVRLRDRVRAEGIGLDDLGAGFEIRAVHALDDRGLRQREQVVVALEVRRVARELPAPVVLFLELVREDHRPHRAVDHDDPLAEPLPQGGDPVLRSVSHTRKSTKPALPRPAYDKKRARGVSWPTG